MRSRGIGAVELPVVPALGALLSSARMPSDTPTRTPEQTAAPSSRRARRRQQERRRLLQGAAILAVAIAAFFVLPAVYRLLERWRAGTIVSQAQELARQQLFSDAIERIQIALKLDPGNAEGLRTLARIYASFELPSALPVWRTLLGSTSRTEEDAHEYIAYAVRVQRFELAEIELARLLAGGKLTAATRAIATDFYLRQGDPDRALGFAESLHKENPDNRADGLRLGRVLVLQADPAQQREGIARFRKLEQPAAAERQAIYEALAAVATLPMPETAGLLDALPSPDAGATAEYFARADALLRVRRADRASIVAAAVDLHRRGPPEEQAALAAWLNRSGEQNRLIETYSVEEAFRHGPVASAYLEALARARRWTDLQKAVAASPPIDGWMTDCFRAAAASKLKQTELAREHWRRALEQSGSNPLRTRLIGDFAAQIGAEEQAIDAYDRLIRDDFHRVTGYRRLAQLYQNLRETDRLRTLMVEWSAYASDDPLPDNAFCYLSGLLRKDLDKAHDRASALVERFPGRYDYRVTLAFVEFRRGRAQAARQIFERTQPTLRSLPAQWRLVQASVLEATGDRNGARALVRGIQTDSLFPEERDLLRQINGN